LRLSINEQNQLLLFLLTLRNPKTPNQDVLSDRPVQGLSWLIK
jgi:hypothetical protein